MDTYSFIVDFRIHLGEPKTEEKTKSMNEQNGYKSDDCSEVIVVHIEDQRNEVEGKKGESIGSKPTIPLLQRYQLLDIRVIGVDHSNWTKGLELDVSQRLLLKWK